MSGLALFMLGPPSIVRNGEPIALERRKAVALLAYLAVTGRNHSRDSLATLFWPEHDQSRARAGLRRVLSTLRKGPGESWLDVDRETVGLNQEADVWLDVGQFRDYLAQSQEHDHPQDQVCPDCLPSLVEAAKLYRDDFLAGFTLRDSPAFDDWQFFETESLRRELASALERLARAHSAQAEHELAIAYARRWLALDPLHEPAHRTLMQLYARSGQRAAALRQYAECVRVLEEEVGAPPEEETTRLYQAIREGRELTPTAERIAAPAPVAAPVAKHNLPLQLTPFVGREAVLGGIADCLQDPTCRLLTLVGPGGSGKTRLALEAAAARLDDFPDGVYFVSLAPLDSVEAIVPAVAKALGLSLQTQVGIGAQSQPRQRLLDYLRQKTVLLIMDNFEHLLEGVGLVLEMLQTSPGVTILATSRATLNVQGEHPLHVAGMALPKWEIADDAAATLADATRYSAVELFLQSARRAQPGFELTGHDLTDVVRICRLVEAMPLGILLAAAWVGVLTPGEIAAEIGGSLDFLEADLRDLPRRQRSMRAVFDHSWRLLTERERRAFQWLSVFRGGFTRQAASQVAGASLRELRALVEKSLLQRDLHGRYRVHELLRQYAAERLAAVPDQWEAAKDRHSAYFAAFLRHREASLAGRNQRRTLAEIEAEIDNVRVGWYWAVVQTRVEDLDRALESLAEFYNTRGWYQEGEEIFARAAQMLEEESFGYAQDALQSGAAREPGEGPAGETEETVSRRRRLVLGKVLSRQGRLLVHLGLVDKGRELLQRSVKILRGLGDRREMAYALCHLASPSPSPEERTALYLEALAVMREIGDQRGIALCLEGPMWDAVSQGQWREAEQLMQKRLAIHRELGNPDRIAGSLSAMGHLAWCLGQYREAERLHQESLALSRAVGSPAAIAYFLGYLGLDALASKEYEEARRLFEESLAIYVEIGTTWGIAYALLSQGRLANALGRYAEASRLAQEALPLVHEFDTSDFRVWPFIILGDAACGLRDIQEARGYFAQALRAATSLGEVSKALLALVGTATLLHTEGESETAVELLALVLHHPASRQWAKDRAAPLIAQLEAELSPDAFAAARQRGEARDLEATVAELLIELSP